MRNALLLLLGCAVLTALQAGEDGEGYEKRMGALGTPHLRPVPLELQAKLGLTPGEGVLVRHVIDGSEADKMGIRPGDVIVSVNGQPIGHRRDLREVVWTSTPGSEANIAVKRDQGPAQVLNGQIGTMPRWVEDRWAHRYLNGEIGQWRDERWEEVVDWQRDWLRQQQQLVQRMQRAVERLQVDGPSLSGEGAARLQVKPNPSGGPSGWSFSYRWSYDLTAF